MRQHTRFPALFSPTADISIRSSATNPHLQTQLHTSTGSLLYLSTHLSPHLDAFMTQQSSPAFPGSFTMDNIRQEAQRAGPSRGGSDGPDQTWRSKRDTMSRTDSEDRRNEERIKSRAVNDLGWNWESERAKMEALGGTSASSSSPSMKRLSLHPSAADGSGDLSGSQSGGSRSYLGTPEIGTPNQRRSDDFSRPSISPRHSSKGTFPPRIDTSGQNGSSISSSSHSNVTNRNNGLDNTNANPIPKAPRIATGALPQSSTASTFTTSTDAPMQNTTSSQQTVSSRATQQQGSSSSTSSTRVSRREQACDACGKPMTGQFVRALGVVFHLDCFRCRVSICRPRMMSAILTFFDDLTRTVIK